LILALAMLGTIAQPASAQENKDGRKASDPAARESGASLPNPFGDTWKFGCWRNFSLGVGMVQVQVLDAVL
jgi:hypothetical protein